MENRQFLPREQLQSLIDTVRAAGYCCIGPVVNNHSIVFTEFERAEQLPIGVHDTQQPGHYRLQRTASPRMFAWANGAQAIKPHVFTPREAVWHARRTAEGALAFEANSDEASRIALFGVRACDLAALELTDAHFLGPQDDDNSAERYPDPRYQRRRQNLLLIGVNCSHPSGNCFCVSTGDGPDLRHGYDMVLDELDDGFLLQPGSEDGMSIIAQLPLRPASAAQQQQAEQQLQHAVEVQQRRLPAGDIRQLLLDNLEHAQWDEVAERCLSCGNCTMVCPTCFCHAHVEAPQLDGATTVHYRQWDSCFTQGHSYIHGITIRHDTRARYRQWLTHKFARWYDQYGRSGCVGCGRCISWCPVGIDVTAEIAAIVTEDHHVSE